MDLCLHIQKKSMKKKIKINKNKTEAKRKTPKRSNRIVTEVSTQTISLHGEAEPSDAINNKYAPLTEYFCFSIEHGFDATTAVSNQISKERGEYKIVETRFCYKRMKVQFLF